MLVRARLAKQVPRGGPCPVRGGPSTQLRNPEAGMRRPWIIPNSVLRLLYSIVRTDGVTFAGSGEGAQRGYAVMDGDELTLMALPGGQCCRWTREQNALPYNPGRPLRSAELRRASYPVGGTSSLRLVPTAVRVSCATHLIAYAFVGEYGQAGIAASAAAFRSVAVPSNIAPKSGSDFAIRGSSKP